MPNVPKWRRFLRFWYGDVAADVDDELRFHFDARAEELRGRGMDEETIARTIAEEFGDVDATRARLREIGERMERRRERSWWWRQLGADLAYALRGLRRTPAFTVGVVVTLAIGIGAAASMYGTMRRLMLQPPPHVVAPQRVMKLHFRFEQAGDSALTFDRASYPFWEGVRDARTLAGVAAYTDAEFPVGRGEDARMARATMVSAGFWRTLGTRPVLGRFIADDEAHPATGARVVVLGHAFWRQRYGGDTAVVGTTLHVRGQPYRVIGVAPRGFRGVELMDTDVWLPLFALGDGDRSMREWHTYASSSNLRLVARLRPGASIAQGDAELTRRRVEFVREQEQARLRRMGRGGREEEIRVSVRLGAVTGALGYDARRIPEGTVAVWLVGVAIVLLAVACANVASLLLLRALRRRREIAVRLALGMSRRRLSALLFTESLLLAMLGGAASVVVIVWGGAWARRVLLPGMVGESAGVDWRMLGVAAACVTATALVTGLVPALQTRGMGTAGLREGAQHGATGRSTLYWGLLVAQTALSALLLVGAGLFLRSLHRVTTTDLGLDTRNTWLVRVDFTGTGRGARDVAAFFERALERARTVPGVASASLATGAPLRAAMGFTLRTSPNGEWVRTDQGTPMGAWVADRYLAATGMRVVQGRDFVAADRGGPPVVIVNEALARHAWPGRSPVGECAYLSSAATTCARVVGVSGNARTFSVREAQRFWLYAPLSPTDDARRVLLVRAAPGAGPMDGTLRRVLREVDPAVPYVHVEQLGAALDPQLRPWRLGAAVFTAFGALAMLLAALGLYTAVAYAVTQRTREIGVRVAVGATSAGVVRLVLGDGARIAAVGVAAGLALALLGAPLIADLLFDTSPRDPVVLGVVGLALLAVSAAASLAPARRAARVSPTVALRAD